MAYLEDLLVKWFARNLFREAFAPVITRSLFVEQRTFVFIILFAACIEERAVPAPHDLASYKQLVTRWCDSEDFPFHLDMYCLVTLSFIEYVFEVSLDSAR